MKPFNHVPTLVRKSLTKWAEGLDSPLVFRIGRGKGNTKVGTPRTNVGGGKVDAGQGQGQLTSGVAFGSRAVFRSRVLYRSDSRVSSPDNMTRRGKCYGSAIFRDPRKR